jgi:hypothetical protein
LGHIGRVLTRQGDGEDLTRAGGDIILASHPLDDGHPQTGIAWLVTGGV